MLKKFPIYTSNRHSNISFHLKLCSCPPDECMFNIHSPCSSGLFFPSSWETFMLHYVHQLWSLTVSVCCELYKKLRWSSLTSRRHQQICVFIYETLLSMLFKIFNIPHWVQSLYLFLQITLMIFVTVSFRLSVSVRSYCLCVGERRRPQVV